MVKRIAAVTAGKVVEVDNKKLSCHGIFTTMFEPGIVYYFA